MWDAIIITCGKKKASKPMPAKDMYQGSFFVAQRATAERLNTRLGWMIFSSRHGLLKPDQIIKPYENRWGGNDIDQTVLKTQVSNMGLDNDSKILCLGGRAYAEHLKEALPRGHVYWPPNILTNRQMGWQLRQLKAIRNLGFIPKDWMKGMRI
ncbi:hypothetical protein HHJ78_10910 [Mobiluncus mulieris]|uniref:DUF6884 domain-containing protein n=1 Tax=Mobiluncus mulieris TaxID=2052 RepID=A0A7Y0U316_9ACTO|nr:DUF6884 domain-containing protein [Mobiluncus mulieris]NMW65994.1 hypothetical protein [Mobiluncus mulieris]